MQLEHLHHYAAPGGFMRTRLTWVTLDKRFDKRIDSVDVLVIYVFALLIVLV